ncbi:aminotransferase class IV [Pseudodesulfovibrio sp. S3]|uniref:aminotransferase class IV n=1 Tax=unclassified Pseudodesulfovibrio TaxID=2661612 RepID=UPI000FEBBC53|nr:aminotransferase class IV [Pseudodesulfovibrio sp. S3]MCJ2164075.1 aminotransferase class IV [Pseudodesulfovibrio sp. S3-i]RWU05294.1 aminodeoxychorismate lyase [Pseudodesulfovibrio sp. S3]
MTKIVDSKDYMEALLAVDRPGADEIHAFYEHRVGVICTDPKMMLMPWDDHLVHRGDGIFETMKFIGKKLYQLEPHMARMQRSCEAIYLKPPCSWETIRDLIVDVARAGGRENGMVRVLLGRGPGGFGIYPSECPEASLYVVSYDLHPKPESVYEKGVTAFKTSIPAKQSYLAAIKSIDYLPNVLMKHEAEEKGYDFPFCFDQNGLLAEGATENVCIVDDSGRLIIPEFTNALAGTTLLRAVDLIKSEMSIVFRGISEEELLLAREIIIVGTTGDAIPVVRFNGKPIHDVKPGPVAKRIRELLKKDLVETGIDL